MRLKYDEQANNLARAIDIAIRTFKDEPPKDYNERDLENLISAYENFKNQALNPEPQYNNISSLKYWVVDTFIFFQESGGSTVELFWSRIKEEELPYYRENRLEKILKKKNIKNRIEYEYVVDVVGPFFDSKLITQKEMEELHILIGNYEERN